MNEIKDPTTDPEVTALLTRKEVSPKYPIPKECDARKVLKALEKLHTTPANQIKMTDAALLPLTPLEKGYVLGVITEYQAKRSDR